MFVSNRIALIPFTFQTLRDSLVRWVLAKSIRMHEQQLAFLGKFSFRGIEHSDYDFFMQ